MPLPPLKSRLEKEPPKEEPKVDAQKQYLIEKIDKLISGVSPGYGQILLEELMTRMEKTVTHFHEEVTELMEALKKRRQEREEQLKQLLDQKVMGKSLEEKPATAETSVEREISEWEKRLEEKTSRAEKSDIKKKSKF